jgi:hypothetical protein
MEIAAKLHRLKQAVLDEPELPKISDVFWEEVAREPWFSEAGHPAENPRLRVLTERVACHVLGYSVRASGSMLIHMPEHGFWHGCCVLEGTLGQVFYFEDVDRGLLTIAGPIGTGTTHFVRFSNAVIDLAGKASRAVARDRPRA